MAQTPNWKLEEVVPGQSGREYVINQNSRRIDAYLAGVKSRSLSTPLSSAEGAYYIVGSGASGVWAGKENYLAIFVNGAWEFILPGAGTQVWVIDENAYYQFTGTQWKASPVGPVIQSNGVDFPRRVKLNFTGNDVTITDDEGNDQTDIAIAGQHTIQSNGADFASQPNLNFINVKVTDDNGNTATKIEIPGQGAGFYGSPAVRVITLLKSTVAKIRVTGVDPVVTTAGTVTFTLRINNTGISGLTNITATNVPAAYTATSDNVDNIVNIGDVLYLDITSVSGSPSAANFSYVFHTL